MQTNRYRLRGKIKIDENTEDAISKLLTYDNGPDFEFTDEGDGEILSADESWFVYLHLFNEDKRNELVDYLRNWFRKHPDKLEKEIKIIVEI